MAARSKVGYAVSLSTMTLTPSQRRFLCAQAHALKPVVQVGQAGITDTVRAALDQALRDHELIKLKFGQSYPGAAREDAPALAESLGAQLCQVIGKVATLYRSRPDKVRGKKKIELPA